MRTLVLFTIFMAYVAAAPAFQTIHAFAGPPGDGAYPNGVVAGPGGVLYAAVPSGGTSSFGVVISLTPPTAPGGAWTENVLYNFTGGSDGGSPVGLTVAPNGTLIGTTNFGGSSTECFPSCGTVFSLTPPASPGGGWTEKVLYSFQAGMDGAVPQVAPIVGNHEVIYGTTSEGGSSMNCSGYVGCGTVYSLTPPSSGGGPWTEKILHRFDGMDGSNPMGVVLGHDGAIYGVTYGGGSANVGAVFRLAHSHTGGWTEQVLYSFTGGIDGALPASAPVIAAGGAVYGTASVAGPCCGTIFSLTPPSTAGGSWTLAVIYSFTGGMDGSVPQSTPLVLNAKGVLFGTTSQGGGAAGNGTVFSLAPPASAGQPWTETVLHRFTNSANGYRPYGGVAFGPGGALYGTTDFGGDAGYGTVFALQP